MSACDSQPPNKREINAAIPDILKSLGTQSCKNTSDISQVSAAYTATMGGFGVSAGVSGNASYSDSKVSSVGCEQVAVAAKQYLASTRKVACILNENVTTSSKTLNAGNSIIFRSQNGDINIDGPLKISQNIEITMIDLAQLSKQAKMSIADEVKQTALQVADTIQESKSGMGATPQGSKTVSDQKSEITSENVNNIVEKVINEVSITLNANNDILIETVNGDINLGETTMDQNILINLTATLITTNAIDTTLKSLATSISTQESKAKQAAENLGADTLGRQAGDAAVAIVKAQGEFGGGLMGIVGGVIVLSIGAYLFFKVKGGGGVQASQMAQVANSLPVPGHAFTAMLPPPYRAAMAVQTLQAMQPPPPPVGFSGVQNGRRRRKYDNGVISSAEISISGLILGLSICVASIVCAIYYFTYDNRYMNNVKKADKALDKCLRKIDKECPWPSCTDEKCPTNADKRKVLACVDAETEKGCPGVKIDDYVSPTLKQIASLVAGGIGIITIIHSIW